MAIAGVIGGLIGSFAHLVLRDGVVGEGELKDWKNWVIAGFLGLVAYGGYLAMAGNIFPISTSGLQEAALTAFVGFTLDDLIRKFYDKPKKKR